MRLGLLVMMMAAGCGGGAAELILKNGVVAATQPRAHAVAVRDGKIIAVGDDAAVMKHAGAATRVVDAHGGAIVAALADGHAHLYGLGRALENVDLRGCASATECAARVRRAAVAGAGDQWIEGRGWDQTRFDDKKFPTHAALDAEVSDRPVWLRRVDGHAGWANARALELARIDATTKDPSGGRIERDASGAPTGVLVDEAMGLVERVIPSPSPEVRERAILRGQEVVLQNGITSVHEMGIPRETVDAYRVLARDGRLRVRVHAFGGGDVDEVERWMDLASPDGTHDDARFTLRGMKLYADGALGSRGAALLAPYSDDAGNRGLTITPRETLERVAKKALATGWQIAVHAIGDRANREVLDAFEAAGCTREGNHRFRVEHVQVVAPADFARFARLGVIASMQPTHATSDMRWAEERLGPERIAGAYAWRRILDAGARLMLGSDFPVEDVPVTAGIDAAVTRGGWRTDQKLTLDEAIRGFTADAAYGAFDEGWRGRAAVGQAADLTVFDRDLTDAKNAQVVMTIIGGRVEYERK